MHAHIWSLGAVRPCLQSPKSCPERCRNDWTTRLPGRRRADVIPARRAGTPGPVYRMSAEKRRSAPRIGGARRLSHFDQLVQVFADVAPNHQGNETSNLGVGERGRHSLKACVHRGRIKQFVKLLVDSASHILQVPADLGWILTGVKRCGTFHASNVDPYLSLRWLTWHWQGWSLRLPTRCHQRMFTSVSPKDVHPVFISPWARRTSEPWARRGLGELGGELVTGSSGMSQVEGFGDGVTEIEVTWPSMPRATPLMTSADPAATEDASAQSLRLGAKTRDRGWPRWPAAWPDGSLRSR